ncbi:hypothetical protein FISHEDRAFT_40191 [Fistulina hepatica ATCC 64428]|uniref:Dolichyldiphosphatase n=1 Tax=Fistulina hepatica ATCC 64428 TaxID=1128425 RepID=A0A0D7AEZ6_9AGAR|nr:hypothetical protein FISHEDRAFT_40191 [Fistulina hepatica ATCC 64428]
MSGNYTVNGLGPRTSLDLTHVLYNDESAFSLSLALMTLSPILLMPAYAALAVQTREYIILVMWAGQFMCEGFNWILKHIFKENRPYDEMGNGYGFPSSHSQYMGYFASFLFCHLYFRHRFASTGFTVIDQLWRCVVYCAIAFWSMLVAYSRYKLMYHTRRQVLCGYGFGVLCGVSLYFVAELIPGWWPRSYLGQIKIFLLENPISTWFQLRDGWAIWTDGGRALEWERWRDEWDRRRNLKQSKRDT